MDSQIFTANMSDMQNTLSPRQSTDLMTNSSRRTSSNFDRTHYPPNATVTPELYPCTLLTCVLCRTARALKTRS